MLTERLFDEALAGAWLAHDDAETSLLAVYAERVEDRLLERQESGSIAAKRVSVEAKVRADHFPAPFGLRSLA
jgi:hypothetical protein